MRNGLAVHSPIGGRLNERHDIAVLGGVFTQWRNVAPQGAVLGLQTTSHRPAGRFAH